MKKYPIAFLTCPVCNDYFPPFSWPQKSIGNIYRALNSMDGRSSLEVNKPGYTPSKTGCRKLTMAFSKTYGGRHTTKRVVSLELIMQLHQLRAAEDPVFYLSSFLIKLFLFHYNFYFSINGLFVHWNAELTSAENSLKALHVNPYLQNPS